MQKEISIFVILSSCNFRQGYRRKELSLTTYTVVYSGRALNTLV